MKKLSVAIIGLLFLPPASAGDYSPGVGADFPKKAFFGDLHLHSNNSPDAYSMGNVLLGAEASYRFARGYEVMSSNGIPARLKRPLDFLAVTDHAEFLGLYRRYEAKDPLLKNHPLGQWWDELTQNKGTYYSAFPDSINYPDENRDAVPPPVEQTVWREITQIADEYNEPGQFTAFAGYEWTSMVDGNNLHRCVIFKDGQQQTGAILPFSAQDSRDPEDLWAALQRYEDATGGDVIAIPHNGNVSNGMMWELETLSDEPLDAEYARTRTRWEPIAEVTQIKGDSETHPTLSPEDEFADFERWDKYNIMNTKEATPDTYPGSYARSALKRGLAEREKYGVNPFKFGMIGSTDDHTSLATAAEDNFFGKFANSEPGIRTPDTHMAGALVADWELSASGLAVIWAEENTRESLFDAMERREVYATTGSRIWLRFFGGWEFPENAVFQPDFERVGYKQGVPMGGDLPEMPAIAQAPTFMVMASKDVYSANLDQIQIIKGWVDSSGQTHEKIYYVALSDDRSIDPKTGKPPLVGSTVDFETVTYTNTIGEPQLAGQWTDPDFDPSQSAFYYARAIEIPKPRWTEYDRKHYGIELPPETPRTVQDRAYSSPIWYTP
jgi:hypothetical protein